MVLLTPFGVDDTDQSDDEAVGNLLLGVVLNIGYALCTTLGSLFIEVLVKKKSEKQSTTIQNIQVYTWMVASSAAYVIGDLFANQTERNDFYSARVWVMTFLLAIYGILASTVLKYASATALLLVNLLSNPTATMLCVPLFHLGMTRDYVLSFFTIIVGIYMVSFASIRGEHPNNETQQQVQQNEQEEHPVDAVGQTTRKEWIARLLALGVIYVCAVFLCPSFTLSVCLLAASHYLWLSCTVLLPLTVSHCLALSLTASHCLSLPLTVSHCLSLSLTVSHRLSLPLTGCLSLPLTASHWLPLTTSHCLSLAASHYRLLPHTTSHCLSYHVVLAPLTDWLTD